MTQELIILIKSYLDRVAKGMCLFRSIIGEMYPLRAWRSGLISRTGQLNDDMAYEFHGIGCTFLINGELFVDFDFCPDRSYHGFDLWRLKDYVMNAHDINTPIRYQNIENLEIDFNQAISQSCIIPIKDSLLFRVSDDLISQTV